MILVEELLFLLEELGEVGAIECGHGVGFINTSLVACTLP